MKFEQGKMPRKEKKKFYKWMLYFHNQARKRCNTEIQYWGLKIPKLKILKRWRWYRLLELGEVEGKLQDVRLAGLHRAAEAYGRTLETKA